MISGGLLILASYFVVGLPAWVEWLMFGWGILVLIASIITFGVKLVVAEVKNK